jgi:SAM-dependent methyltransferase
MVQGIKRWLAHPATRGLNLDDPLTTEQRRNIIQGNRFLWQIYDEWYRMIARCVPEGPGRVTELGSGAGFLGDYIPDLITSEVFPCSGIQVVFDARQLPFPPNSLKMIALVDVLHHVPDVRALLRQAQSCVRPGGTIAMIEPWVSSWSRLVYGILHHEPFDPSAGTWAFPETGVLSGANGALPWIVFQRDQEQFEKEFSGFEIQEVRPFMPLRYLLSGGVSMRQLMPGGAFGFWRAVEKALCKWPDLWPMFAFIHLRRRST